MQYPVPWALFAIFLLSYVFPFAVTLLRLLRWEVRPVKITRSDLPSVLPPMQRAAVDELAALGFTPVAAYTYNDDYQNFPALLLKHATEPAFANLHFQASSFTGYPVWFWSFPKDGDALMTSNRQPLSLPMPGVAEIDPYKENLAQQWQAHQDRLRGLDLAAMDTEEAFRRIARANEDYVAWNLSNKTFIEQSDRIFFSLRAALKMTWEMMRRRRDLRRPYKGAVLADAYRSTYYAELYALYEGVRKRLHYRIDVAIVLLIFSFAVSFGAFSWWMGWRFAAAVLIVLTVHEFGHAIAMRLFGYKDMNMFFIPFVGAVVVGDIKNISVWRQTIVLLAGPVPGLVFGILVLLHMHQFPPDSFIRLLGLNAVVLNLFNLLPLSFLDGGKLVEIALLSRWPYSLFAFWFISSLGMFWLIVRFQSYYLLFIGLLMAMATRALWRIAGLRKDWEAQDDSRRELKDIFELAGRRLNSNSFNRQYFMVRTVFEKPAVNPPRWWETALALSLFVAFWASSISVAWSFWHHRI